MAGSTTSAVWAWNETVPEKIDNCVHILVHEQAKTRPDALAVDAHDGTWTYRELDEASDILARYLVHHVGIRAEDIIPLCFEKSKWAVIGILGVLKAGAAIVFLDPSHPQSRIEYITSQISAKVIICSPLQQHLFIVSGYPPTLLLSSEHLIQYARCAFEVIPGNIGQPENLLYIIFTSGSTGQPKGCEIEHGAFLSGSLRHAELANIHHDTRILQLASFTFDVSMLEILTSLVHGACICIPDMSLMSNGPAYLLNEYRITWTFMTPSLVKLMTPDMVPLLRTLALGGEPLSKVDVETWADHVQLINGYGPSECSVAAAGNTQMTVHTDPSNIGYPVGGVCWIVDADNHDILLPPNEVGELLIEGPILARGYFRDEERTAQAFITRPAWGVTDKRGHDRRLYKTGDLAKFLDDGSIQFLGRKDTQVKLRGFRIELGEIEHHIAAQPDVYHQAVLLPRAGMFANHLVAIVSLKGHLIESLDTAEALVYVHDEMHNEPIQWILQTLRKELAAKVPEYMVPEYWIVLESFPLLLSGKLNRSLVNKWLSEANQDLYRSVLGLTHELLHNIPEIDEQLCSVISRVLGLAQSSVVDSSHKSFFSIGGDSITAMQVVAKCRGLGLGLSVKDVLRSKSLVDLSRCIKVSTLPKYMKEEKVDTPFELSPVQRMFFDLTPEHSHSSEEIRFNQSFFLNVRRMVDPTAIHEALERVVARHSMLRARFDRDVETSQWIQKIPSGSDKSFRFLSHDIDVEEDALPIMAQTQAILSLRDGPVFAAVLFKIDGDESRLFLVAHHVMIDLVSWRTIIKDLEESIVTGSITAEKPLPFQSWLALQADHAQTIDISKVLPYSVPPADLDYWGMAETPNIMGDTVEASFKLDQAMTKRLLEGKGHSAYRTEPIDILLASLVYSFGQIFRDRQPPAIFREGHGREPWDDSIDVSETVGWFTTMYPLLIDIKAGSRDLSILDVIKRTKDVRHSVPSNGRPYFASRYLNADGVAKFSQHDHVEISFDYLGLYQQMERPDSLLTMVPGYQALHHDIGAKAPRFSLVEVTAEVLQGQMQLLFFYNKNMAKKDLIQSWIAGTNSCLVDAVDRLEKQSPELTLSDVPLLQMSYDELEIMVHSALPAVGIHNLDQVESICPGSAMQNGLLLSQLRPGRAGAYEYNHVFKITPRVLSATLDIQRLKDAWDRVVQRHTSLRTVFIQTSGISGLYDQIVLSGMKAQVEIRECTEEDASRVFESQDRIQFREGGALHRLTICEVSPSLALCRLEINHAITDGLSIANLLSDFVLAYDGLISERPGFVFEAYIKYTLELPADAAKAFWMDYLADVKPTIFPAMAFWEDAVATDRKLGSVTIDIGVHPFELSRFCDDKLVTWVNVFQLAWGLILKQYTGTEDVCFGFLSSGRDAPLDGIQEGVGAFLTMLVSSMTLNQGTTLSVALQDVARGLVDSLPHQYFGLANIQHGLNTGNQPLFNTIISFHRDTDQDMHPNSGICIEAMEGHDPTEYVLSLDVGVSETKVKVSLQFWTDEITRPQAKSIGATYAEAVKAIITHPETDVGQVNLVGDHHIEKLSSITAVNLEYVNECVHHAITRQALAAPDHEAICSYEGSWSYAEVDRFSSQLAHHLVACNIGPEVIVPYCFPKSAYAIISMLAILKAGGAAVALDPGHPVDRLCGLIHQCGSTVVLVDPQTAHLFSDAPGIEHVLVINEVFFQSSILPAGMPDVDVEPHHACFVVFTSGTTGQPKGIVLEHRNLRTCAATMGPVLGFGPETRALQFAAYVFDVSLQDILTTLSFGGTVCVISDEQRMEDLSGGINFTRANWADLTATVSGMLHPADVPTLKRLNNGGEALNRNVIKRWAENVELYNLYGPAETTINQTASSRLSKSSPASNIGPAYGTNVWVVDERDHNFLVPPGCAGEILIEGPLVARGYLNDPEMTAAAFIKDPIWASKFPNSAPSPPRRLYKSGDSGIMNTDGSITILGRRDAQVKINGQRVELDEVMYQVQRLLPQDYHVAVDATSVKEAGQKRVIVAFVSIPSPNPSCQKGAVLSSQLSIELKHLFTDIKHSLAKVLPSYMVPSIWIPITEMPYTISGKLDRQKLRDLVKTIASSQETVLQYPLRSSECLELPANRTEEILQELFGLVLDVERSKIGRYDDFFALGGDSVGAMKLVTAARKHFGMILHVTDILKHPTLSDLAATICDRNEADDNQLGMAPAASFDLIDVSSALPEAVAQCKVSPVDIEDIYPTSAIQEGMMALGLRSPGAYITQAVFALPSTLDTPRMQAAWDTVARIHGILRTRIIPINAIGHMQVVTRHPPSWTVTDVDNLEGYLARDKATVFGYGEPLLRLAIVRQTFDRAAYFVWTAHHAVYDGWSMTTLFNQVADAFWGKPVMSPTPFKHFIRHIASVYESAAEDFWKETLDGRRSCPVSFPPTSQDYASSSSGNLATKITVHAKAPGATASGSILESTIKRAAWALTLASFSDSRDIVFAQTLSGRNVSMSGIEGVMGPTIATVPVRVRFPTRLSGVTMRSFLENLQAHAVESMKFEQTGLQRIRELSIDARNAVDNISNLFVIQPNQHDDEVKFLGMEPLPRQQGTFLELYPLTVLCNLADAGEYTVEALFDENVISSAQITRILQQFQHMVQQLSIISNMDTPLDAIKLLNPHDLHDISKWNADLPMRVDACIPDLISENVALRPDSEAVCAWDGRLSYQEFDRITFKLSSHLASLGVGREVRVGLCFEKSIWNLVSMYAVMRTGGVCVSLLPTYPKGRITDIIEDTEASLVLVSPEHSSMFEGIVPNVLSVDQSLLDSLRSHMYEKSTSFCHVEPRDAAFIVFTSGSTGRPKGVVIEHSGFCTMAHHQLAELMLGPESRVLQFATHTFDICLFESFAPLVRGGCVCIPSEHQKFNNLVQAINEFRVDWIIMVSTIAQTFYPEDVPSLKTLVLGGEPLRADIHARWASRVNLFNDFGPAECSILAVMTPSTPKTPPSMIGKAHGGRTWVVDKDDHDRLLPIGCVGELLIEGPILARGYLNDPQKTADSYVSELRWAKHFDELKLSSRFYKTGDLVQYAEDGNLICLGRKDTQVKVRGLRVELGEIEYHVNISPLNTTKQAVEKVLLGDDLDKAALAAFVVPSAVEGSNNHSTADHSENFLSWSSDLESQLLELRQYLKKLLPAYMVPTLYIPLQDMPETQTNKIDRKALKRIGAALKPDQIALYSLSSVDRPAASGVKRAPSTKTEILLQGLWARLMNIETDCVDAHDNFFAKGGDSIKAMHLTSLARSHGLSLIVADIFKNPELSQMALVATWLDNKEQPQVNKAIQPFDLLSGSHSDKEMAIEDAATQCSVSANAIRDLYPCTPLQEGLMELATQRQGAYTAQRVFRLHCDIDVGRFQAAWSHLVSLHPILRTRIILSSSSGEALQVVIDEDVTWQQELNLPDYLAADNSTPIHYGSPLARYALDAEHRHFIWTAHHALYDGYSSNMLMEQLSILYRGSRVHPPVTHYNSFVRDVTSSVSGDESQAFWTRQLAHGAPESFPRLPSATHRSCPDSEITMTINFEGHHRAGNPYMISTFLRAAWALVTARHMGSQHVAFAATNSGRNANIHGIDTIVGPTITTVPLHIVAAPETTIEDFLDGVQQLGIDVLPFEQAGVQRAFAMADRKQNLRNLFVIQQSLVDDSQKSSSIMDEVVDKALLRGFHVYPVVVECNVINDEKVHVQLQFDKSVLAEPTAGFVLEQFEHVIDQLLTPELMSSGALLADISLVPSAHVEKMVSWNEKVDTQVVEECVHDIFRRQANARPDAEAVVSSWEGSLTYRQLDEMSDRLALHLVERGIRPERLVPMCFDKSIYTVVAMMATLKAGGACVHLGIKSPSSRMIDIIRQADASVILTDISNSHKFVGQIPDMQVVTVDASLFGKLPARGAASSLPRVSPTNPAFVLFTSGSTGKPKGVVVEHGSLCTSSRAHGTDRKIGPDTRLFQFAAYTFDVSVADIFTTLQRGGCVCVPSEDERINDISGAINRLSCNYAFLTPTVAGMVEPSSVPGLRTLILGGELATSDNIHHWAPRVDLIISYGVTECSIHCVDAVPLTIESHPDNLGCPSGCHMWIVDENDHNKLAPLGAVGELLIEGRMVSRGYLNDKTKTDAVFITNPSWASAKKGSKVRRMYKTGDLCRYSPAGEICYVSRKDFQVKHHGQRIELGDIEHHTGTDGRVRQNVVLLPERGPFEKKLVAVLSLKLSSQPLAPTEKLALVSSGLEKGIADLQVSAIRSYLATKVPDYMVPAVWIAVQALPLTPNNKLDRMTVLQWLEQMDEAGYQAIFGQGEDAEHDTTGSSATSQQKLLHDVLTQVLGLPKVHMGRSFLNLGGDSITAMQLRAKCRVAGLSLTVPDILTSRNMFDLASAAQLLHTGPKRLRDIIGVELPVTAWQQACLKSTHLPQMVNTTKVTPAARITIPNLLRAVEALVQQYSSFRTRFSRNAQGQWAQTITKGPSSTYYTFRAHSLSSLGALDVCLSNLNEVQLDVETETLFSVHLFHYENDEGHDHAQVVVLRVHTLIADARSMGVLVEDLLSLLDGNTIPGTEEFSLASLLAHTQEKTTLDITSDSEAAIEYCNTAAANYVSESFTERTITLDKASTSLLMGDSNRALSTIPQDIVIATIILAWREVLGRYPSSIAVRDDSRPTRAVGQFSRLRQNREIDCTDWIQILARVKDSRVGDRIGESLMRRASSPVEVLIETICLTASGQDHDHDLIHDTASWDPHSKLRVTPTLNKDQMILKLKYDDEVGDSDAFAHLIKTLEQYLLQLVAMLNSAKIIPTPSDFPALNLDYAQLEKLETTLDVAGVSFSNVGAIVRCTPLQQRMLESQKRIPGSWQSDTAHRVTSGGAKSIDVARLQRAFVQVTARHEALRTIFLPSVVRPGEYYQLVLNHYEPSVQVVHCEEAEINNGSIMQEHHTVTHASMKPHVGLTLFQTESSLCTKLEISHALQDGASIRIIYQDLARAYQDPEDFATPSISPSPGFREYAAWLEAQHQSNLTESTHFWTQYLDRFVGKPCHIPRSEIDPAADRGENVLLPIFIDTDPAAISQICPLYKVTPSTFFLGAWATCLQAVTGMDEVMFAHVVADRDVADFQEVVGPLINMLGCRVRATGSDSGADVMRRVHESFLETLPFQRGFIPAVAAMERESLASQLSWNSALSVEYVDGASYYPISTPGASDGPDDAFGFETLWGSRAPEFDVVLGVLVGQKSLEVQLGYWDGVMDSSAMRNLAEMYQRVVSRWLQGNGEGLMCEIQAVV